MVPTDLILASAILVLALAVDRLIGDPHSPTIRLHSLAGSSAGRAAITVPPVLQRAAGILFWLVTVILFSLPFFLFGHFAPRLVYLIGAPFLLKCCFAWRSLEEHALGVVAA